MTFAKIGEHEKLQKKVLKRLMLKTCGLIFVHMLKICWLIFLHMLKISRLMCRLIVLS